MSSSRRQYPFHLIEPKWQKIWDEQDAFRAFNPGDEIPAAHPFAQRHQLSGKVSAAQLPKKFYILDMFPYPSGAGLHVGHPEGYTATDILARYKRAQGFNVLHPMGWDAFGLPAEQYAVKTGQHPRKTTEENIATFKRQIKSLGFSYDWSREIATTDTDYFKWTQWIFLKLYNSWFNPKTNKAEPIDIFQDVLSENPKYQSEWEKNDTLVSLRMAWESTPAKERQERARLFTDKQRLAFVSEAPVWWCEELGTVLANEEVVDGKSEVGGFPVVRKPMRQWMLRISAYAERLIADLNTIDWTDSLKEMQRNWIGRSEGAEVIFRTDTRERLGIKVFTTRPDTLFGATYLVLAPEHQFLNELMQYGRWPENIPALWKGFGQSWSKTQTHHGFKAEEIFELPPLAAVETYRVWVSRKNDLERTELAKEKTGVFTGLFAINPVNGQHIPIFMADYVLASYGTGAIMAVPAHDQRDLEFALKFGLLVKPVVSPSSKWLHDNFFPPKELLPREFSKKGDVEEYPGVRREVAKIWAQRFSRPAEDIERVLSLWATWAEKKPELSPATETLLRDAYSVAWWLFSEDKEHCSAFTGTGLGFDSSNFEISLTNIPTIEAKKKVTAWLEEKGLGKKTVNFKLRDWLFSRQRYWGEPFPIIWKKDETGLHHEALPETALPLLPPSLTDYKPTATGEPPLARAYNWVHEIPNAQRETNTMPQWAGSCWYYLRYPDAKNNSAFVGKEAENYWMSGKSAGVDLYVGGTEHAVLHLLYARFWHKVLFDLGYVSTPEPFFKLVNQGMVLGEDNQKMSKSRGNVIPVDVPVREVGTDALRLYEMFMGPLEMVKPWSTKGVEGVYRFLGRVWRLFVDEKSETEFEQAETTADPTKLGELLNLIRLDAAIKDATATPAQLKTLHACIKKVTEDLDGLRFNTAISALMVFVNEAMTWETKPVSVLRDFLILLQPFAPHLAEELWAKLPASVSAVNLAYSAWPKYDPALLVESEMEIPVQVNGKLRDVIKVPADITQADLEAAAKNSEKVKPFIEGKTIKKVVVVPKKLVNLIAV